MLPPGVLDGLEPLGDGRFLVSTVEGRLFRVDPEGGLSKIYDSSALDRPCADIEVVRSRGLVLVPTYLDGQLVALGL